MAKMLLISASLENEYQIEDDIVTIKEDNSTISNIEQSLFLLQICSNVTRDEIYNILNNKIDPDNTYPKYPFSLASLSQQQKDDLENINVNHDDTLSIINSINPKSPIQ